MKGCWIRVEHPVIPALHNSQQKLFYAGNVSSGGLVITLRVCAYKQLKHALHCSAHQRFCYEFRCKNVYLVAGPVLCSSCETRSSAIETDI